MGDKFSQAADPNSWLSAVTLPLTNNLQSWFDADSLTLSRRFYRAVKDVHRLLQFRGAAVSIATLKAAR